MLYTDYEKQFVSGQFSICRGDYTNLPTSMIAEEFSDKQMQELVDEIDAEMRDIYSERDLKLLSDYHAGKELSQQDYIFADDMSAEEFYVTESTAVRMGMRYWEDLSDDEFEALNKMIVRSDIKIMN